jgi:hypothetical protein
MDFVGVNCAACHVGELRHGDTVRVDGAPNMFNLQLFYSDAIDAVMAATSEGVQSAFPKYTECQML